jgi:YesN/AraC family two-component response regulator
VDMALSGEEAIKKDKEKLYDLVITDLMMPGISGLELLTSLKTARPEVNIVMITGYPTIKTAVRSVKIGAFDYIAKPFTPQELRTIVSRAFKKEESEKEEIPSPQIPKGLYVMKGHTWLRKERENLVTTGVLFEFLKNIGQITHIEMPQENKNIFQGEVCARIIDSERNIHRVWSPATGRIIKVNKGIEEDLTMLKKDPYQKGWLFQIESLNIEKDLEGLVLI